jgi:hypothetical protein
MTSWIEQTRSNNLKRLRYLIHMLELNIASLLHQIQSGPLFYPNLKTNSHYLLIVIGIFALFLIVKSVVIQREVETKLILLENMEVFYGNISHLCRVATKAWKITYMQYAIRTEISQRSMKRRQATNNFLP